MQETYEPRPGFCNEKVIEWRANRFVKLRKYVFHELCTAVLG